MPIRLDKRLTQIANLVDYGKVADVGCDHGKLGYYLISTDRASEVIATDISAMSLKKAKELAEDNGVSSVMQTRLGDGLKPVASEEVDTVVIAGLGGDVISSILKDAGDDGKTFEHFILSSNTHPEKVRREIVRQGHRIIYDEMLECGGKVYTIIKTERGEGTLDDMQIAYGANFRTSETFAEFASTYLSNLKAIYANGGGCELYQKIARLEEAIEENRKGRQLPAEE